MRSKKYLALLLVVMLVSILAVGCGSDDTPNTDAPATNGNEEKEEGEKQEGEEVDGTSSATFGLDEEQYLTFVLDAEPSTLDPSKGADNYSNTILLNVMEPLLRLEEDSDNNTAIAAAGAESWEANEDGTVWTFKIRDNTWSDGVKVRAQDYEYGIKRSLDPDTASPYSWIIGDIKNASKVNSGELPVDELGVKALDDETLEITLENPTPYFEQLTYNRTMLPQRQDIVEAQGDKFGTEIETVVFNGPFTLSTWVHNSELILTKNESYWNAEEVLMETVNLKIIQDENARLNSLTNGEIDGSATNRPEWREQFMANEDMVHYEVVNPTTFFMFFNTQDEVFSNANIRKAFSAAVDREELANVIFDGIHTPAYGWVPPTMNIGDDEYRSLVDGPVEKLVKEEDPVELLQKGLEELGMDTDPSKLTVTISLGGTDQWFRTYGEYLQQVFNTKLGVDFQVQQMEWPVFDSNVNKGDFQIGYMSWGADYNDPSNMLNLFRSDAGAIGTGWVNERYDELIDLAGKEMDVAKRLEYFREAEGILLYEDAAVAPIVFPRSNIFRYEYVHNLGINPFSTQGYKNAYTWFREPAN